MLSGGRAMTASAARPSRKEYAATIRRIASGG
jgi:hypothetical protein